MTTEPGRVMALDVGGRRIGVAMSDTMRILASPHVTLRAEPHAAVIAQIVDLITKHEVAALVVGLPLTLSGEVGPQAQLIHTFVAELAKHVSIPIHLVDERLTSVEAERMMLELGMKRDQRRARIDELAASIILRDFLESQRADHPDGDTD